MRQQICCGTGSQCKVFCMSFKTGAYLGTSLMRPVDSIHSARDRPTTTELQWSSQRLVTKAWLHHGRIHSFGHFYGAPSNPLLLRGTPDYSTDTVSEFPAEAHRQLQVKDLPKVLAWRLEWESNPRPSG